MGWVGCVAIRDPHLRMTELGNSSVGIRESTTVQGLVTSPDVAQNADRR